MMLSAALLLTTASVMAEVNQKPRIIPELTSWTGAEGWLPLSGRYVVLTDGLLQVAATFASDYQQLTGQPMSRRHGHPRRGDIVFVSKKHDTMPLEGYQLSTGERSVEISSPSPRGAFWATRTLLQMLATQPDTYPGLTATDGSYTKQEFVELQLLAEENGVEIIPEIDSPAHSLAFTHYRPDLASAEYGMDHLDLGNPDVYTFMDGLFREYLSGSPLSPPVFRGPRVCIGTDEYSNARQEVVEQFRAYTDHYLALVEHYGKQPTLWGALTHARGTTPVRHEGVLMNCWYNGYAEPDSMRSLGYQLVSIPDGLVYIVPKAGYYNDYLNCEYLYANWTPATIGNKHFAEQDPQIEGGMFALWNDIPDPSITIADLHDRIAPALRVMAAKTWTGQMVSMAYSDFVETEKALQSAAESFIITINH